MADDAAPNEPESCPDCGAMVANAALHRSWHTELPRAISSAVINYIDTHRG
jgi:hypothetical protein